MVDDWMSLRVLIRKLKSDEDGRSNARITDKNILRILQNKSDVEIFERDYNTELMILKIDLIIKLFHLLIFSLLLKNTLKAKLSLEILEKVN